MLKTNSFLCLILILAIAVTIIPTVYSTIVVYAAEEEEDEKEEEESSSKDEDEEKEEEETEEKDEEEQSEEEEEQSNDSNETIQTLTPPIVNATQIIQDQFNDYLTTTTTTEAEPIINEEKEEFNATCKCKTVGSPPTVEKPTTTAVTTGQEEQIPVTSADIQESQSFGEVVDPAYTNYYVVPNLLDTIINDKSFWSQAGKSSFYIKLDNVLDSYQVCSMELNVYDPSKNTPYLLDVGVSRNYTGILDQTNERIQFEKCVKNMDEILMIFDNPSNSFVSIGEIKLFGSKLGTPEPQQQPAMQQPPLIPPTTSQEEETENATKINIQDSTAEIDIKNSTITFKFDPLTATFVQGTNQ